MPLTLDEMAGTKKTLTLDEMAGEEVEPVIFGREVAIPRKLPNWFNSLLSGDKKKLEALLPLEDKYRWGTIIGLSEDQQKEEDRLVNTLYFSVVLEAEPEKIDMVLDELIRQKWNEGDLSQSDVRRRLEQEYYEQKRQYYKENLEPFSLFGNAFIQSLAGKPAAALRGVKVYTPGEALGFDWLLGRTSEYLDNLRDREKMTATEAAAAGKLWPIEKDAAWYKVKPELLPETINAWSATVGDQIPIMLMTIAGRTVGKVIGKPVGVGVGGLYALITGGPDPTDVVTAPVIAKVTEKVVEHLFGAAPLVAMEAGYFMDRANELGIDTDISEKYARRYGLGSGAIEYAQWLWNLRAFKMLSPKVKMSILKKVLIEIGGATWEGIEELSQQGLENFLIGKAIDEQKVRTPEYDVEKPETWAGAKRAFGIGLGVSLIVRAPGHTYTSVRRTRLSKQIQDQTDATAEEAGIAVNAMAEGGAMSEEIIKVIAEQKVKKAVEAVEKPPEPPPVAITPEKPAVVPAEPTIASIKAIARREGPIMAKAVERLQSEGIETTSSNLGGKGTFKSLQRTQRNKRTTWVKFPEDNVTPDGIKRLEQAGFAIAKSEAIIDLGEGDYDRVPMLEVSKQVPENLAPKEVDQWNEAMLSEMANIIAKPAKPTPAKPAEVTKPKVEAKLTQGEFETEIGILDKQIKGLEALVLQFPEDLTHLRALDKAWLERTQLEVNLLRGMLEADPENKDIQKLLTEISDELAKLRGPAPTPAKPPVESDYVYHSAFQKNLESIVKSGLKPKDGKPLFFAQDIKSGLGWGNEGDPLFRVAKSDIPQLEKVGIGNFASTRKISPNLIEVSLDKGKTWQALAAPTPAKPVVRPPVEKLVKIGQEFEYAGAAYKITDIKGEKVVVERTDILAEPRVWDKGGLQVELARLRLAKRIKAPKELLGGVAKKPPGLTKAEVEHLGKREREALRAAQEKGYPVGYKKGVAETLADSRRSLDAFRMKEAISQKGKMDVANVVLTYVPKEKQGDYIRRILEAKTQKRIERLTEAIDKYLDKYEKRQAIRDFKKFVKDAKKKYRRGEVAFGKLPVKLSKKLTDVLDKFDLAKISEKKEETLESRLEFVTRISGELAQGFEQLNVDLDKDATDLLLMGTRRIEELKRLSQKYIGDLDVDEIRYIQASLEHLIKINDLKGQSKERRRIEALRTHINQARQEVSPPKEIVELTGVLGAVKWLIVEGQSTIRTLVGLATGKDNASTAHLLIEELDNANVKRKETYKDFIMYFRKLAAQKGLKWGDASDLKKLTKITIGGKEIQIDYDNLLALYAHTQAEGNLRRLLNTKGLNITVYFRDENGIFTKKHIHRVGKPTLSELRSIAELVPDAHKKLLDVYFKANWEKQAPAINETSMAYQNYELARQKQYFHVSREAERIVEGRKADLSISINEQGRYLPRTGGNARINIAPFSIEVMKAMQSDAAYHTMTIPMENARTLVANHKWREAMKKAGQQKALQKITTMLRRTQGLISDQSVVELTASRFLGTVGKSILSLRFSGSLVQTASVPAAIEFIDKKYLSQIDIPKPSDIKRLKEISPVLWMRWEAKQFDFALGMVGAQDAFEILLFEHKPITSKFLFPYTAGDEVAIAKLFMAAERQIETETNFKRGTDEFQKAALDLLYKAMNTQPQWDMLHRSPLTSDPSVLARSITMFMSARNAQYNVLVRAIDDYRKGRITKSQLSERLAGVGMANLLVSVARHTFKTVVKAGAIAALVAMGIRKPPDDKEIQAEAERLAKKIPIETVFNLIGLNALGTLFVSMGYAALKTRKYGWQAGRYSDIRTGNMLADLTLDIMQTGIDFTLFTDQLISGEKYKTGKNRGRYKWEITGKRLIDDITLLIAYRFGLPYEGIKSDIVWPTQAALREKKTESAQPIKRK